MIIKTRVENRRTKMSISNDLEKLSTLSPELFDEIKNSKIVNLARPRNQALDHLQGCLLRAIAKEFPCFEIHGYKDNYNNDFKVEIVTPYYQWIGINKEFSGAILSAYLTMLKSRSR
jgi:hypothetical protein